MYRRIGTLLVVVTVLAVPGAAFAAAPDRGTEPVERMPLMERVWDGLVQRLGLDEDARRELQRAPEGPRSVSAADDVSGDLDPDG